MDIFTHAGIGLIVAGPFIQEKPELAVGIVAGSVLPDLDALCRLAGKRTFLRHHQTWSHSLPVQAAASAAVGFIASRFGWNGFALAIGLFAGLASHTALDMLNTFGVAWLYPFSRRRLCLGWVFFIDAVVLAALLATLLAVLPFWFQSGQAPFASMVAFTCFLMGYILLKGWLKNRAAGIRPEARSLVPSAFVPWRYIGTRMEKDDLVVLHINAVTASTVPVASVHLLDRRYATIVGTLPDYHTMRELSPEYHVIGAFPEAGATRVLCRDMRTRNFGTRFGDLEVWLDANEQITRSRFHV